MSATHANCLNCNHPVSGKFCNNCGQKTDTHRITAQHFITHDLLHGVWHVDRGLFFTLKESVSRAGAAAMEYIEGKRIKYYNVFYLALLLLGTNLLLQHYFDQPDDLQLSSAGNMSAIADFLQNNIKIIILLFIPVISLIAYLVFKKSRLNLAEHAIIAGFLFCGIISLSILKNILSLLPESVIKIFDYSLFPIIGFIQLLYPTWTYYQSISKKFSKLGFTIRLIVFYLLTLITYILVVLIIIIIFNYIKTGKMEMEGELLLK